MVRRTLGEERARRLEETVRRLLRRVERLGADDLYREPGPGEWSAMQVMAHMAEAMPYWARQARLVASRPDHGQPFGRTAEDPDRIAAVEQHAHDALEEMLARLRSGLAQAVATLRAIPLEGWTRVGRHAHRGEMTVEQLVARFLVSHMEEHAQQVEAALALSTGPARPQPGA
jgi:uncharacterized damage-inducible protein DinB